MRWCPAGKVRLPHTTAVTAPVALGSVRPWSPRTGRTWLRRVGVVRRAGVLVLMLAMVGSALPVRSEVGMADQALRILGAQCWVCHQAEKRKGGLALDSPAALLRGGDSGVAIVPGQPEGSLLLKVLGEGSDPHMPPKKQLEARDIGVLREWIAQGAHWSDLVAAELARPRTIALGPIPADYHPVVALALSSDGRRLAVGRGREIHIFETGATNGGPTVRFEAHGELVRSLAWMPDGRQIVSGSHRELRLWDASTGRREWAVSDGLVGQVTALRITPYGRVVVAADGRPGMAGWIRLFDPATGKQMESWRAHDDVVLDLAVSREGGLLTTGGGDRMIKVWDLLSRREVSRLEGHVGAVPGVAFHPSEPRILSAGADKQIKIWDFNTRESLTSLAGRRSAMTAAAWSADGAVAVAGDESGNVVALSQFKLHTGEQSSASADEKVLGHWPSSVHAVGVNRDGTLVVAAFQDGAVRLLNREGGLLRLLPADAEAAVVKQGGTPAGEGRVAAERGPSFVGDVLPVLAKAGCSGGACHAKADGQNGFKLSVFSYDPMADYREIVSDVRGRRVFPAAPEESLLLLKATLAVPHEGGQRFERESEPYRMVLRWMREGMPYRHAGEPSLSSIQVEPPSGVYRHGTAAGLKVTAVYSDGSRRDVSRLADYVSSEKEIVQVNEVGGMRMGTTGTGEAVVVARYMGLVAASRVTVPADRDLSQETLAGFSTDHFIDALARAEFQRLGLRPSPPCTDAEFLRRVSLDLVGVLPTAEEAREFLADTSPGKRLRWVGNRLAHPAYADYWANKWADLLRPNPDRVGVKSVHVLDQWLREAFRANLPYDRFARAFIEAEGSNHRHGPTVVYRDRREPPELTTLFSQIFLGVRMECAKCHHHPSEKWGQEDFYQLAAYFGPVQQRGAGLSPPISAGTETFFHGAGGTVRHPVTDEVMNAKPPDGPPAAGAGDPRQSLADWLTRPGNPFFARAAVNRVWSFLFGRGFVEPVDDFRVSNPVSMEPVLDALARRFESDGFDLKKLLATIVSSRLYQLSSLPGDGNSSDLRCFSRSYRRRLPAETLLDAVADVTGIGEEFNGCPPGTRAMQTWSYKVQSHFLDAFGRPNASSDCPCERDLKSSVVQALHVMNSKGLQAKLSGDGRVKALASSARTPAGIVEELYLAALSRHPTSRELEVAAASFGAAGATRQTAAEDVLWALLNSPEFLFNH